MIINIYKRNNAIQHTTIIIAAFKIIILSSMIPLRGISKSQDKQVCQENAAFGAFFGVKL
jgi:hypothetical protein